IERENTLAECGRALAALQAANDELEHMSKVGSNFIAAISHEFHTALTGKELNETMRNRDLNVARMRSLIADLHLDAPYLVSMINNVLRLDCRDIDKLQLDLEWLDLNTLIRDIVRSIRPSAPKHRIRLQFANVLPILQGNRDKLTDVVAYLLRSIIEYSPEGGEVRVATIVEGNVVHISVHDNGPGMPVGELERLCVRQVRVEPENRYHSKRTGMDLSMVCEVVQMHGGQFWVENVPGKGSTFHFTVKFTDTC
ncbi:MAG: HAMP domain-containing histidine kinase, partial [Chloroflexi bacterium]|nr:HAMP domain-containing histidine kinase [Chloroflexota bacterium]